MALESEFLGRVAVDDAIFSHAGRAIISEHVNTVRVQCEVRHRDRRPLWTAHDAITTQPAGTKPGQANHKADDSKTKDEQNGEKPDDGDEEFPGKVAQQNDENKVHHHASYGTARSWANLGVTASFTSS